MVQIPHPSPSPQGAGAGVGSVTSTPKDRVHTQRAENVILEKHKNNLWVKYPTPAPLRSGTRPDPTGAGICAHTFCLGICAHTFCSRDAHSECNIPAPQGEGLGVGSVTSTPRDRAYTQSAENVILEKHKNNLWLKYPTFGSNTPPLPLPSRGGDMRTHLLPPGCSLGVQHPRPCRVRSCA